LIKTDPIVTYCETVTEESSVECMTKSPNKHNRLTMKAEPLNEELTTLIENGKVTPKDDVKSRSRILIDQFDWDKVDATKIWSFGPENTGANLLVDTTKAVQFMNEIRDSCENAFQWATKEGAMCQENMRGIRFNIVDATLHTDAIHRGGGQIIQTARRCFYASELSAVPSLQEPIFSCEITAPMDVMGGVYNCLN